MRDRRYRTVRRVTLIGAVLDLVLGAAKLAGGWWSNSQALIADGVHSLSDLATDILVVFAAKHASVEADDAHPYGHGRIETAASVALGVALALVATGIAFDAVATLFAPESIAPLSAWALAFAAVSVVAKESMYHYTMHFARRLRSPLLRANAWHTRSDAASSIVVIVGVGGTLAGLPYLDAVAAMVVALMIARIGYEVARSGVAELIDTGLAPEQLDEVRRVILSVDGVSDLHQLRTRRMAGRTFADVHVILADPRMSLSEGHMIGESVRLELTHVLEDFEDVTVHVDPEDDADLPDDEMPAPRQEVIARLERCWSALDAAARIKRVNLHYLQGKIHVELELPLELAHDAHAPSDLERAFSGAAAREPGIASVRLLFS